MKQSQFIKVKKSLQMNVYVDVDETSVRMNAVQ